MLFSWYMLIMMITKFTHTVHVRIYSNTYRYVYTATRIYVLINQCRWFIFYVLGIILIQNMKFPFSGKRIQGKGITNYQVEVFAVVSRWNTEVKHAVGLNTFKSIYLNIIIPYHLIRKLQPAPLLDNGVRMTLKCSSFILLKCLWNEKKTTRY